jgi:hypothetical protein
MGELNPFQLATRWNRNQKTINRRPKVWTCRRIRCCVIEKNRPRNRSAVLEIKIQNSIKLDLKLHLYLQTFVHKLFDNDLRLNGLHLQRKFRLSAQYRKVVRPFSVTNVPYTERVSRRTLGFGHRWTRTFMTDC